MHSNAQYVNLDTEKTTMVVVVRVVLIVLPATTQSAPGAIENTDNTCLFTVVKK
jgi:hypothetical protein